MPSRGKRSRGTRKPRSAKCKESGPVGSTADSFGANGWPTLLATCSTTFSKPSDMRARLTTFCKSTGKEACPTPQGTGERRWFVSKPATIEFMPTSITTASFFSQEFRTQAGFPTQAISMSARRTCSSILSICEWQSANCSICPTGVPTVLERSRTTAAQPERGTLDVMSTSVMPAATNGNAGAPLRLAVLRRLKPSTRSPSTVLSSMSLPVMQINSSHFPAIVAFKCA
mmetsp:Transcript_57873/g.124331  ORF Transcript_57873/g.124331 Transcript_57873/m.124331 type:complete len:229 (+) Transcript_57873:1660-2346(+)